MRPHFRSPQSSISMFTSFPYTFVPDISLKDHSIVVIPGENGLRILVELHNGFPDTTFHRDTTSLVLEPDSDLS